MNEKRSMKSDAIFWLKKVGQKLIDNAESIIDSGEFIDQLEYYDITINIRANAVPTIEINNSYYIFDEAMRKDYEKYIMGENNEITD